MMKEYEPYELWGESGETYFDGTPRHQIYSLDEMLDSLQEEIDEGLNHSGQTNWDMQVFNFLLELRNFKELWGRWTE